MIVSSLTAQQIDFIKAELERRRGLLTKRLEALEERKRRKRKVKDSPPAHATETSGTKVSVRSAKRPRKKVDELGEREKAVKAARLLGADDDMLRQMGLL